MFRLLLIVLLSIGLGACAKGPSNEKLAALPTISPITEVNFGDTKLVQLPERPPAQGLARIKEIISEHLGELHQKHKIKVTMLGVGDDHIFIQLRNMEDVEKALSEEELQSIRKSVFDIAGGEIPLKLSAQECCKQPNLTGKISSIKGNVIFIINEEKKNGDTDDPEATYVTLADEGKIIKEGSQDSVGLDQLKVGQRVNVWTTGLMLTSYPGQASALKIEIAAEVKMITIEETKKVVVPAQGSFETVLDVQQDKGQLSLEFETRNISDKDLAIQYGSGQKYDIAVFNEDGNEVYRWSWNKAFTQALIISTLNKGSKLEFTESWDLRDQHGERVPKGRYRVEVQVIVALDDRGNKKQVNQNELVARQTIELK